MRVTRTRTTKRARQRLTGGLAAIGLAAAVLSACGSSHNSSAATGSSAGSPTTASGSTASSAPVPMKLEIYLGSYYTWLPYIAAAKGFFAKNGINAKVVGLTSGGSVAFAALANGSADVAMGDLSLSGPLMEKGVGLELISGAVNAGWELVAPKGSAAPSTFPASVQYLKGKPVGVVALGSSSYYYLQQLSTSAGLGANGVNYTALGGVVANAVSALGANRVAAAMVSPDAAYYLINDQGDRLLFNTSSASALTAAGGLLGTIAGKSSAGMWARTGWLNAHPGVAKKFQLAMDEADVWMHQPANLAQVISTLQAEHDLAAFEQGAGAQKFFAYALPDISAAVPGGQTGAADFMNFWVKAGLLTKALPTSQWYSSTIPTTESQVQSAASAASGA